MGAKLASVTHVALFPFREPFVHIQVLFEFFRMLSKRRRLIFEMARREIADPFSGSFLGVSWAIFHPLILITVYVLIFSFVFKVRVPAGSESASFTLYMLSGYLPWMTFGDVLIKSCSSVADRPNLAKQVVFPVEVLPFKGIVASLVPQLVGLTALAGYGYWQIGSLGPSWLLIFPILFGQIMILSGIAFTMAALSVYFRDLKQLATVAVTVGFYLTPILYSIEMAPDWLKPVLSHNPITYYIAPLRDACYYGSITEPNAWIAFGIASVLLPVFGFRVFRRLKPYFASAL
jgi:lipopolysaccharide transport system permease protein